MTIKRRGILKGVLSGAGLFMVGALPVPLGAAGRQTYTLATATRGGTYYPVGVAISTLVKARLSADKGIDMSARNSAGSIENITLLQSNRAQFAIVLGIVATLASKGEGPFADAGPVDGLRSVTALWPDVEHFLVRREHRKSGDLSDLLALKGRPVSIGRAGSGSLAASRHILRAQGIDPDTAFRQMALDYGDSAAALMRGDIDAASMSGGLPVTAVTQLYLPDDRQVALLEVTDAQLKAADAGLGIWFRRVIPLATYPGQSEDIASMAQTNALIARADVDEEAVYQILKTVYQHLDFLYGNHPATKAMSLAGALEGLTVPLHPGAVRYYREAGIAVPQRLLP